MIKKTIKYHDFEGEEREDDFYFNLTNIEMNKLDSDPSLHGGFEKTIARIQKNKDAGELLRVIDLLISRAYGVKLPDGSFVKRNASGLPLYEMFVNTEAYDNLMLELIQDDNIVTTFLTGCLTKDAQDRVKAKMAEIDAERRAQMKLTPIDSAGQVE